MKKNKETKAEYKIKNNKHFLKIDGKYQEVELKDFGTYLKVEPVYPNNTESTFTF